MSNQLLRGDLLDPHDDPSKPASEVAARLPHPGNHGYKAHELHLHPHGPSVVEKELHASLQGDPTERLGHPGVQCCDLPHGHAHPLPQYSDAVRREPTMEDLDEARAELLQGPIEEEEEQE